jgi:ABC-type transport system involved in multi-copper enzyme maturation permease subunit
LPAIIITPVLTAIIVYFGIGLTVTVGKFFMFTFILFLTCFVAVAIGTFISSIFKRAETAVMMTPVVIMPLVILGGFFANS